MKCVLSLAFFGMLVALSAARPDLSLGYRYNQGHASGGSSQFLSTPIGSTPSDSASSVITTSFAPTASGSTYFNAFPTVGQVSSGVGTAAGNYNGFNTNAYNSGSTGASTSTGFTSFTNQQAPQIKYAEQDAYLNHLQNYQPALVSKNFYLYSAPVDHDEQQIVRHINIGRARKNYRVVFIDAPSTTASRAKIIANVAPTEDKTAIYVLSRKTNALDVSADVITPAPVTDKPEVFFIKYKTPEEAAHAQRTIQAQYDSLGGSSDVSNEGVIPVSSVIGSLNGESSASAVLGASSNALPSQSVTSVQSADYNNAAEQTQSVGFATQQFGGNTHQTYLPADHK